MYGTLGVVLCAFVVGALGNSLAQAAEAVLTRLRKFCQSGDGEPPPPSLHQQMGAMFTFVLLLIALEAWGFAHEAGWYVQPPPFRQAAQEKV